MESVPNVSSVCPDPTSNPKLIKKVGDYHLLRSYNQSKGLHIAKNAASQLFIAKHTPLALTQSIISISNEVFIAKSIHHPNLVQLCEVLQSAHNVYLFYEYCQHGVLSLFYKNNPTLIYNEKLAILVIRNVINGYKQLYDHKILHRNIKLSSIFLSANESGNLIAKLGCFEFSKIINTRECLSDIMVNSKHVPTPYSSPEICLNEDYNYLSDVYAIGVVLYLMLFGKYPLIYADPHECRSWNVSFDLSNRSLSVYTIDFIHRCLQYDLSNRIHMASMLSHKIMTEPFESLSQRSLQNAQFCLDIKEEANIDKLATIKL
jgi:serine/threonine protein kinase